MLSEFKDKVSIIIPCRVIDYVTEKCVASCERTSYPYKEIIVVPDDVCLGYPATKRNWAMERAQGSVFAFIDSDTVVSYDWLHNALNYLRKGYAAVCGPGVLAWEATIYDRAADAIYRVLPYSYRVTPRKKREVAEFPTFNLIVWKDKAVKFQPYLTGEDSLFCRALGGAILYHPSIMVYHQRRPLYRPLWRQVGTYGKHRGHFIRLALFGLISILWVYGTNFIKGFLRRKI